MEDGYSTEIVIVRYDCYTVNYWLAGSCYIVYCIVVVNTKTVNLWSRAA